MKRISYIEWQKHCSAMYTNGRVERGMDNRPISKAFIRKYLVGLHPRLSGELLEEYTNNLLGAFMAGYYSRED